MADALGSVYQINGDVVPAPDEEVWSEIVLGEDLDGLERRSPYQTLTWRKNVGVDCDLEWFDYDGQELTSLICTPPGAVGIHRVFTRSQKCISVSARYARGVGREITAVFLVDTR